jgi:hypothetical protein
MANPYLPLTCPLPARYLHLASHLTDPSGAWRGGSELEPARMPCCSCTASLVTASLVTVAHPSPTHRPPVAYRRPLVAYPSPTRRPLWSLARHAGTDAYTLTVVYLMRFAICTLSAASQELASFMKTQEAGMGQLRDEMRTLQRLVGKLVGGTAPPTSAGTSSTLDSKFESRAHDNDA